MHQDMKDIIAKHFEPIFKAYDKDHNSTLEKPQLRPLLADNLGVPAESITDDQLNWHFSKIDENNDGKITFEEYFNHFFGQRAVKAIKDQNKNGDEDELIDKGEFAKLMEDTFKPLGLPLTQEMVDWNFGKIDEDNSGRITFKEYMEFIRKYN